MKIIWAREVRTKVEISTFKVVQFFRVIDCVFDVSSVDVSSGAANLMDDPPLQTALATHFFDRL